MNFKKYINLNYLNFSHKFQLNILMAILKGETIGIHLGTFLSRLAFFHLFASIWGSVSKNLFKLYFMWANNINCTLNIKKKFHINFFSSSISSKL